MLAPEHGVCSGFWRVYACEVIPSVMTPSETALPCRTLGPPATSRGCYQRCHLGFLLRQAGWQGALVHCRPWQSAVLCQLCLHSPHQSVLAGQNGLSQQQPHKPALCTQELNFPSLLEDLHYSSHAAEHRGLCSNSTPLQADPALCCWPCSILQDTSTLTFCIVSL